MTILAGYLSVWEIAHRWLKADPNKTDPENLPFVIQDAIRFLCTLVLERRISIYYQVYFSSQDSEARGISELEYMSIPETLPEIKQTISDRKYASSALDAIFINRSELFRNSLYNEQPFPDFWLDDDFMRSMGGFSNSEPLPVNKDIKMVTARESFIDKTVCQAIAKTLWDIDKNINITHMAKHPSILNYGGGKKYVGKNTLRDWLREVAPEHIKNNPGRPKTINKQ